MYLMLLMGLQRVGVVLSIWAYRVLKWVAVTTLGHILPMMGIGFAPGDIDACFSKLYHL